jgi:hypothetical protein
MYNSLEFEMLAELLEYELNESFIVSELFALSSVEIKEGELTVKCTINESPIPEKRSMRKIISSYKPCEESFTMEHRARMPRAFCGFTYTMDVMSNDDLRKINYGLRTLCKSFGIFFAEHDSFLDFTMKDKQSIVGWEQRFTSLLGDYDASQKELFLRLTSTDHEDMCRSLTSLFFASHYFGTESDYKSTYTVRGLSWVYELASELDLCVNGDRLKELPCWDEAIALDMEIGVISELPFFFMETKPYIDRKGYLNCFCGFDVIRILATLRLQLNHIITDLNYKKLKHISDMERVVRMGWVTACNKLLVWIMRIKLKESKSERYVRRFEATPVICDLSTPEGSLSAYFLLRNYFNYEKERLHILDSCERYKSSPPIISNSEPQMSIPITLTLASRSE